jgi:hypothetical protein
MDYMMRTEISMKQYVVYYMDVPVEYTGYFKSISAVRKYLKSKYAGNGFGLRFKAIYPKVEEKVYVV